MPTVKLDNPNNSTMFTTCCGCAICDDQNRCPKCKEEITPQGGAARWRYVYGVRRVQKGYGA